MTKIQDFTDLLVWQEGHKLSVGVYKLTDDFPKSEQFSLISQMRRAASSVTANIAEGFGRKTHKDQEHFYIMSSGSLYELRDHLHLALDVGYITSEQHTRFSNQCVKVHQLLHGLLKSHNSRKSNISNLSSKDKV
jgi:four helix bundle protein